MSFLKKTLARRRLVKAAIQLRNSEYPNETVEWVLGELERVYK